MLVASCKPKEEANHLRFINQVKNLKLSYQNTKCGEWGGDIETIIIYRDNYEGPLFADYLKQIKNCEFSIDEFVRTESKNRIKVSDEGQGLIIECINQLSASKLSRENFISHVGLRSQVILSDSSLIVYDYPSAKWTKFEMLTKELLEN